MSRKRTRATDDFRASAVLMLEAAGYPAKKGAMQQVSNRLGVAPSTLRGWYSGAHNPPPAHLRHEKKVNLIEELKELLGLSIDAARETVGEANYRELMTGIGILVDKVQLLSGEPTWRGEIIDLLRDGTITREMVVEELGDELATELFDAAGVGRA